MLQFFAFSIIYQALVFYYGGRPSGFLFFAPLYLIVNVKCLFLNWSIRIKRGYDFLLSISFIMLFVVSFLMFFLDYAAPDRLYSFLIFFFVGVFFSDGIRIPAFFYYLLLVLFIYILFQNAPISFFHTGAISFSIWRDGQNVLNYQSLSVALIGIYILAIQCSKRIFLLVFLIPLLFVGGSRSVLLAYLISFFVILAVKFKFITSRAFALMLPFALIVATSSFLTLDYVDDAGLRFFDSNSLWERIDLTIFHINNSISLGGYFAHDVVKLGEEGAYAHNFLDFLFGYGLIGFILSASIISRQFSYSLSRIDADVMIAFFDIFLVVYTVFFGNNLSIEFSYLLGKFLRGAISIRMAPRNSFVRDKFL